MECELLLNWIFQFMNYELIGVVVVHCKCLLVLSSCSKQTANVKTVFSHFCLSNCFLFSIICISVSALLSSKVFFYIFLFSSFVSFVKISIKVINSQRAVQRSQQMNKRAKWAKPKIFLCIIRRIIIIISSWAIRTHEVNKRVSFF